jgi:hypothetical protein
MFAIGKEFHVTHVVGDLRKVDSWYDDIFAPTRYLHGPVEVAGRNASLIAIGDLVVEPMEPLRVPNLRNQSVTRFRQPDPTSQGEAVQPEWGQGLCDSGTRQIHQSRHSAEHL